jgi:hypothetical protein
MSHMLIMKINITTYISWFYNIFNIIFTIGIIFDLLFPVYILTKTKALINGGIFMTKKIIVKYGVMFTVLTIFMGLLVFTGCKEKTKEVMVEKAPLITVDSIVVSESMVTQGASVTMTAAITTQTGVGTVTFTWHAEDGTFDNTEGDTVTWKAPDEDGVYIVSVHVTDGENIAIGTRNIGVNVYAPTQSPYYVSVERCDDCHSDVSGDWELTAHADAWVTLMSSDHAASYCFPCHSVGYEPTPNSGNSGYDEAPIEKFVNVQCENCHDAGSIHQAGPSSTNITISYDVMTCGKCHEGEHHPYLTEWEESAHGNALENHGASNSRCQGCHEGVGGAVRLSGDLSEFYGSGSVERPDTTLQPIVCQTCHNPHSGDNPGQLRTFADVALVEANGVEEPTVEDGGAGKICMQCHHARHSAEEQLLEGDDHFGPHASNQGDMLAGKSGYEGVATAGFDWGRAIHLYVENSCKTCHLNTQEFAGSGPAVTGHTFEPTVEACKYCHGVITDFSDIPASDDFDGNGLVEGLQVEVEGLLELLTEALIADGLDTTGTDIAVAIGDTSKSTYLQREAGYNLIFVEDDGSMGVHNPRYAIKLLQQSYQHLTGSLPENAVIIKSDEKVVRW